MAAGTCGRAAVSGRYRTGAILRSTVRRSQGWIGVCLDACDDAELRSLAVQAYCMVAPKKLQARVEDP